MSKKVDRQPTSPDDENAIPGVDRVAKTVSISGETRGIAVSIRGRKLEIPIENALVAKRNELQKWLLTNGLEDLVAAWSGINIGARLLARSKKTVTVLTETGLVFLPAKDGTRTPVYVWDGEMFKMGDQSSNIRTLRTERAAEKRPTLGDPQQLQERIAKECQDHPMVLVTACFALSAAIRRLCGQKTTILLLSGGSTTGKTATQRMLMAMLGSAEIEGVNHTANALLEEVAELPDAPVFLDELDQQLPPEEVKSFLLSAANGTRRKRSKAFTGAPEGKPVEGTPIISTNEPLQKLIGNVVAEQIRARVFVVEVSEEMPMFDRELVDGVGDHAIELHEVASTNYGGVWNSFLKGVAAHSDEVVRRRKKKMKEFKRAIKKEAGYEGDDQVTDRKLNGLAFAAYAGYVARKTGFWSIQTKTLLSAFANAFRRQLAVQPATQEELDASIIEEVYAIQEQNLAHFQDLAEYDAGTPKSGIAGWIGSVDGETFFLWYPPIFEKLVLKKVMGDVYGALKRAGLTKVSEGRGKGRLQIKLGHIKKKRPGKDFIAISKRIRY